MARKVFRAGVSATLTDEQLESRLADVRARAAGLPKWADLPPLSVLGGLYELAKSERNNIALLPAKDALLQAWKKANTKLAEQMEVHLQWGR